MKHDLTGPVRVREWKSLLIMLGLIAVLGASAWGWWRKHPMAAETQKTEARVERAPRAERPDRFERMRRRREKATSRPVEVGGDGVYREDSGNVLVKSRGVSVAITINYLGKTRIVRATRTYSRGGPDSQAEAELWETARAVLRMQRDLSAADQYYNLTQEQLDKIAAIKIKMPRLTAAQEKKLVDLYLATEAKRGAELPKADKALMEAVAEMPISEEELDAMQDAATEARNVLRPDQLDLIDGSVERRSFRSR